jgi:3-oxoacyl-[acyl-carrier protein] reductase
VNLTICARGEEAPNATAAELAKNFGVQVNALALDVTTADGRARLLAACPRPDILVNNAGAPPAGDFRDWTREDGARRSMRSPGSPTRSVGSASCFAGKSAKDLSR